MANVKCCWLFVAVVVWLMGGKNSCCLWRQGKLGVVGKKAWWADAVVDEEEEEQMKVAKLCVVRSRKPAKRKETKAKERKQRQRRERKGKKRKEKKPGDGRCLWTAENVAQAGAECD